MLVFKEQRKNCYVRVFATQSPHNLSSYPRTTNMTCTAEKSMMLYPVTAEKTSRYDVVAT